MKFNAQKNFTLYPWQIKAIHAWERADCKGIIEAVTGSGKTRVGLEAIDRLSKRHDKLCILIVVPTAKLLDQWYKILKKSWSPGQPVGRIGSKFCDNFSKPRLACVGIINSVLPNLRSIFPLGYRTLLIADECHRYTDGPQWSKLSTTVDFDYTLGLSATVGRFSIPGIGSIVYEYKFSDASKDDLLPKFHLVRTRVRLTQDEESKYLELDKLVKDRWKIMDEVYGEEINLFPQDQYFKRLQAKMKNGSSDRSKWDPIILKFLLAVYKRSAVCHESSRKIQCAQQLAHLLASGHRKKVIVFFERTLSADFMAGIDSDDHDSLRQFVKMHRTVSGGLVPLFIYHSGLPNDVRIENIREFESSGPSILVACRSLDEGLDIPQVDAAIIAASTRSPRQRIQRIGRTLRRGEANKQSIVISLHASGTTDSDSFAEDENIFGEAADIFDANDTNVFSTLVRILGEPNSDYAGHANANEFVRRVPAFHELRPVSFRPPQLGES